MLSHENVEIVSDDAALRTECASSSTSRKRKNCEKRKRTPTKPVVHPASAKRHEKNTDAGGKERERENEKRGAHKDGRNDEFQFG